MNEKEIAEERKERKKGEKCNGEKKGKETKKKSGEPAARNELEVNQTYRSYCSRYHYHLPNYYLQQVYIWTLPRLSYSMHRIVCQNSEITYVLYPSRVLVEVFPPRRDLIFDFFRDQSGGRPFSSSLKRFFEARVPIFVFAELGTSGMAYLRKDVFVFKRTLSIYEQRRKTVHRTLIHYF